MPRTSRTVVAGVPHHVTQRGNRREDVFFTDQGRALYLKWLKEYCDKWQVDVFAYCLMTNHVHLILRPETKDGLHRVLKPLHMRYAQYVNRINGWNGHIWQGRYFSAPLDEAYTYSAIRYVERNPVRANLVVKAEDYTWSSASYRVGQRKSSLLVPLSALGVDVTSTHWREWLSIPNSEATLKIIRRSVQKGLPCGNDNFISAIESKVGRKLRICPPGRPKKG
jgi:putative transposase